MFLVRRRIKIKNLFVLIILLWFSAGSSYAGPLQKALEGWRPAILRGIVMDASLKSKYIIVNEKKIFLVNVHLGKVTYKTSVMNLDGRILSWNALSRGREVIVKGSAIIATGRSNSIEMVAKEIYVLPGTLSIYDDKRVKNILAKPATPW